MRYVYDRARTPLQRLFLSGVLAAQKQQELAEVAQALDPILLFQQVEQLQQALFRGWRSTHKDPFEGGWEQIMAWLLANPERSSGDIF